MVALLPAIVSTCAGLALTVGASIGSAGAARDVRGIMADLIDEYVSIAAQASPERSYVTDQNVARSYAWMDARSSQLAHVIAESGGGPGDRVAIVLPKGSDAILAMHGVLKAGCAYVPIDTGSPVARTARIIEAAEPRLLIGNDDTLPLLAELAPDGSRSVAVGLLCEAPRASSTTIEPRFELRDLDAMAETAPNVPRGTEDIAHLLFTSGSTGQPKGVPIRHRQVVAFIEWATRHFALTGDDRVSGHSPFHFDLSTFDIYGPAASGAHLFVVPPLLNLTPGKLANFIRESRLTQWFSVPSVLTLLAKLDAVPSGSLPDLRRLIWCGEVLPTPTLRYWMEAVPDATHTNLYGPTEATIASSFYDVPARPESDLVDIPIGVACEGEELVVLDDEMRAVSPGEIGDIYIGGVGLAPGYWRDPTTTAAAFKPDPRAEGRTLYRTGDLGRIDDAGLVWFVGRKDTQIKSRGYRIELGEIETALLAIGELADSCVVGISSGGFEGTAICCAYVSRNGREIGSAEIRSSLADRLPSYMLPSRWMALDELPKNANGKIDRPRIRSLFEDAQTGIRHGGP